MTDAYPLQWPDGWPRTPISQRRGRGHFQKRERRCQGDHSWMSGRDITLNEATRGLMDEVTRLGGKNVVISSNLQVRLDGLPRSGQRQPDDGGVAVYFDLNGRQVAMARDAFVSVADNVRSLALAIEHMRGLERHGGGHMVERAFTGFAALPAPAMALEQPWYDVLGLPPHASADEIKEARDSKARSYHPDTSQSPNPAMLDKVMEAAKRGLAARAGPVLVRGRVS